MYEKMKNIKKILFPGMAICMAIILLVGATNTKEENLPKAKPQKPDLTQNFTDPNTSTNSTPVGTIENTSRISNQKISVNDLNISSKANLIEYRKSRVNEAKIIMNSTNYTVYPAIVTFNKPLSKSTLKEIETKHKLKVILVRYESTVGGGEMPYNFLDDNNTMRIWEDKISADQKKHNKIDNFKLIEGFSAMKVAVNRNEIEDLQNDNNTFLVDLGPKELYTGDNSDESTPWRDVAYFVKNYLTN